MLLGQLVAISVASNLFYIAVLSASSQSSTAGSADAAYTPPSGSTSVPFKLWAPVLIALATVPLSPFTSMSDNTFIINLLVMHTLIVVPLFFVTPPQKSNGFWTLGKFYNLILLAAIPIRSRTLNLAWSSLGESQSPIPLERAAWETLHSHPAQSSIGWDVVWTSVSFVVWILWGSGLANGAFKTLSLTLAIPFASVGVAAPYALKSSADEAEGSTQERQAEPRATDSKKSEAEGQKGEQKRSEKAKVRKRK